MLVVFVSIAASECFALFFCLSCKNNQKNAVADDSWRHLLPTNQGKEGKRKDTRAADSTKRKAHARRRDVETTRCSETETL